MESNRPSVERVAIALPLRVEVALWHVLRHYWNAEQEAYKRLPPHRRVDHIFEDIRLLDDWLFLPTGIVAMVGGKVVNI